MIADWLAFWDGPHSIYVNDRHRDAHYRLLAGQFAAFVPSPQAYVLDYGSGDALHADLVADVAGKLLLCEGAPGVLARLKARYLGNSKIEVTSPDALKSVPDRSFDLIVLHSVLQYLTEAETTALLASFHRLLKSDGTLIVGDVIPPNVPAAADAWVLLRFGAANGFFAAAFVGLVRTFLSDYWRLRSRLGLTRHADAAMMEKLAAAGFIAERAASNIGHNPFRRTYRARLRQ